MGITYTIARNLAAKKVITTAGEHIGVLSDLIVDEMSGRIESVLVEANMDSKTIQRLGPEHKLVEVPYGAVKAVQDFVIVDERELLSHHG
ncbi:MAG TPA: PRC-barrel domain-containing protein [archaeon]|nr:PRC-barrel domain-containing protein [archaeon]